MAVLFVVLSTLFLIGVYLYPSNSTDGELLNSAYTFKITILYSHLNLNIKKRRTQRTCAN